MSRIRLKIISAEGLVDVGTFGAQSPYVLATALPGCWESHAQMPAAAAGCCCAACNLASSAKTCCAKTCSCALCRRHLSFLFSVCWLRFLC